MHIKKKQTKLAETVFHNFITLPSNSACLQLSPHQSRCWIATGAEREHLLPFAAHFRNGLGSPALHGAVTVPVEGKH